MFIYKYDEWQDPPTLVGSLHSINNEPNENLCINPIGFIWGKIEDVLPKEES